MQDPDGLLMNYSEKCPWVLICNECQHNYYSHPFYFPPRCVKMLAAAAQEFMVKVFEQANKLETSNHLRAETLAQAAKELGLTEYKTHALATKELGLKPSSNNLLEEKIIELP